MNGLTTYQDASRRETIKGKKMTKGKKSTKVMKARPKKRMGKAKAKPVSMPSMPSMAEMMKGM